MSPRPSPRPLVIPVPSLRVILLVVGTLLVLMSSIQAFRQSSSDSTSSSSSSASVTYVPVPRSFSYEQTHPEYPSTIFAGMFSAAPFTGGAFQSK